MRRLKTGQSPNARGNDQRVPSVLRGLQKRQVESGEYKLNQEVDTGQTWIDGRPIYRYVRDIGSLPNAGTKTLELGFSYREIVEMRGVIRNGLETRALPYNDITSTQDIEFRASNTDFAIQTAINYGSWQGYAIFEYTKQG